MDEQKKEMNEKTENQERKVPAILDPEKQLEMFQRGKMVLQTPIVDGENTVTELEWDFLKLTGSEYVDAMDMDQTAGNVFRITQKQAFCLFAAAAAKCSTILDAKDIRENMGMMDAQKAIQTATVFFAAMNRVGNRRILNA